MNKLILNAIFGLGLTLAVSSSFAAFINFIEDPLDIAPVTVMTNIVLSAPIVSTPESARVSGLHHPGISPNPISTSPGKRAAVLFEPGSGGNLVSDYVLLTVGDIRNDAVFGQAQDLLVEFFSADILLADLLQQLAAGGFAYGGGLVEDGTLQNLSALLGTLPEGLLVGVQSDPGDVPEPASLALVGLALAAAGLARRRVVAG